MSTGLLFDQAAKAYQSARPSYPVGVIDWLLATAGVTRQSRIAELGAGTGKATELLVQRGYRPVCIEPGNAMASVLAERFPELEIQIASVDAWNPPEGQFDLVYGAQCFHWFSPAAALQKIFGALRSGGTLGILWNFDESFNTEFYQKAQAIYEVFFPQTSSTQRSMLTASADEYTQLLQESSLYERIASYEETWSQEYTTEEWIQLRKTFSPDLGLPDADRAAFHAQLATLLDSLGGHFTRSYRTLVLTATATRKEMR